MKRLEHVAVLACASRRTAVLELLASLGGALATDSSVHASLDDLLATGPQVVAECAGHGAVREHGAAVLASGCDLVVISSGALADAALNRALQDAARQGNARLVLPAGAIGGMDVLHAARLSGLEAVTYSGRKPPRAWRGTPAERMLDLDGLKAATAFFDGAAREAVHVARGAA